MSGSIRDDKLLTAEAVAEQLGVSLSWVHQHSPKRGGKALRRPELPVVRIGGNLRYRQSRIDAWVRELEQSG